MSRYASVLALAADKCRYILSTYPGYHPMYTVGGKWKREGELWTHWCEGFYPGIYWLLHQHTSESFWRTQAEEASRRLEPRRFDRNVHDLGFLFMSTYLRWYHLTGDEHCRRILIDAGRTLALRRQMGGYLRSFVGPESLFIDIMMNVGIILWAGNETNDEALRAIAIEHCRSTRKFLVREDGGTAHEGVFDVTTGEFQKQTTHQGHQGASTWTRGLAWAIYGYTTVYRLTGMREFRDTAELCAACYLRRAPADLVPPWDFDAPVESIGLLDSSAAAITASGLFDLANAIDVQPIRLRYREAAFKILDSLCTEKFVPFDRPNWEGILMHGVYHLHKNLGVDESVAWGDHFFVEALVKALQTPRA